MDYAEGIIEYFVDLRGKGATVSSLDQQAVLEWERAGVPLPAVLDGIDDAFARKAEPPKSVRDCKRWVTKQAKVYATRGGVAPTAAPDAATVAVAKAIDAGGWAPVEDAPLTAPLDVARAWLSELDDTEDARLAGASATLRAEVEQVAADEGGTLPEAMLAVLDDVLATLLLAELPADEAALVRVACATAANRAREQGHADDVVEQHRRRALRSAVRERVAWPSPG